MSLTAQYDIEFDTSNVTKRSLPVSNAGAPDVFAMAIYPKNPAPLQPYSIRKPRHHLLH